ncbi:hypothetical protein C1H46_003208 [Malus baccata]|uniref:Uncharacterized protein n=1 Tax=Malus baccata TaxID=106549 RepID=A0A540NJH9_MALBA|nr:hypothetical protein C1H46_003208 [Malus baccata]
MQIWVLFAAVIAVRNSKNMRFRAIHYRHCLFLGYFFQQLFTGEKISDELDKRAKKFLRGAEANLEGLKDKKLKGQLAVREELYGKSAQAAAKAEKNYQWLLPSEGGYLETEGIEKTWRIKQESIALHLSMPPNAPTTGEVKKPDCYRPGIVALR